MIPARRQTRQVKVGSLLLGAGNPIRVQSMTKCPTTDVQSTLAQIARLESAGCEIVRVGLPDPESVEAFRAIREQTELPLVADIHFRPELALAAIEAGADKIRINPGNMPDRAALRKVLRAAAERGVVVRVGVNSGSVPKQFLGKHGGPTPQAMVEAARQHVRLCEEEGLEAIVVSLKSSRVADTLAAYRLFAAESDCPLHLGLTEAGPPLESAVRSALALGPLISAGIGDTIRISVTGDPVLEVQIAYEMLRALRAREGGFLIVSCPTCTRQQGDVEAAVEQAKAGLAEMVFPRTVTIAIMGCEVNGPGEAKDADLGIAFGLRRVLVFRRGTVVGYCSAQEAVARLLREAEQLAAREPSGVA